MKKAELSRLETEFLLLISAKPKTAEGKQLLEEAKERYFNVIDWSGLAKTPIAGDDVQKKSAEDLLGPCEFEN
jgi:hypothetical protein